MSTELIETVSRSYEAWNRRDFDAALAETAPEVRWEMSGATLFPGLKPAYRGREGLRQLWDLFTEGWEDVRIEVEEIRAGTDSALALIRFHVRARAGLELVSSFAHVFDFRDGRIVRIRSFDARDEALAAAGMPAGEGD